MRQVTNTQIYKLFYSKLTDPLPLFVIIKKNNKGLIVNILRGAVFVGIAILSVQNMEASAGHAKRIAITIDDAPSPSTPLFTGQQRALSIIDHLRKVEAPPVGVFAIGGHVVAFGAEQLRLFGLAGHAVCNHTYSHRSLKSCSADEYVRDIQKAEALLKELPGYAPLFRHPYLDEGRPVQAQKVNSALKNLGYTNARITINNCDYYMSHILQKALHAGKRIDYEKLRTVYLQVMLECVDYFDGWSTLQGKESMNHVLLMHSNDLTALYIGDLIQALRDRGWTVISIHDAYKPVPSDFKNTPSKIAKTDSVNPARSRNSPKGMSFRYLAELFRQEKVFVDARSNETYTASN
jgi:peptidoglycan/xylan/chitin deacetylase (PgdA/CDA1 family)